MPDDPIIDEIRAIRHRISEEFGHDPKRLVEHYMDLERTQYADRIVRPATREPETEDERTR